MGRHAHPPELIDAVGRLWRGTRSASEIGAVLGLTRNAVIGIVTRYRLRDGEELWPFRGPGRPARPNRRRANSGNNPSHFTSPKRVLANPILWLDRDPHQCAWIEDDPADNPIDELQCCGAPVEAGSSWCGFHGALVTADPEERARRLRAGGFRHHRKIGAPLGARAA